MTSESEYNGETESNTSKDPNEVSSPLMPWMAVS